MGDVPFDGDEGQPSDSETTTDGNVGVEAEHPADDPTPRRRATQGSLDDIAPGLFPNDTVPDELVGYRVPSACQIAGITYRQLDYWARTSLVVPSIRGAAGSGSQRLYSFLSLIHI